VLPVLAELEVGGTVFVVPAYSTFLVLAACAALALAIRGTLRLGVGRRAALVGFALAIAAGLAGARALSVVLDWEAYASDPAAITALRPRGFALYGGLGAGAAAMLVLARAWGVGLPRLADASVPAIAAGLVLLRIGCFLHGCCAGSTTTLPWGARFPLGSTSWTSQVLDGDIGLLVLGDDPEPVHPTQLYEIGAVLVAAALAAIVARRAGRPGDAALAFVAIAAGSRALIQLVREPVATATLPVGVESLGYLGVAAIAAVVLLARTGRPAARVRSVARDARA
jgi:phosphatidylglycerol:prolipoprotein diacylglycerol transferase